MSAVKKRQGLTEEELRSIIKKRIMIEELRYSTAQKHLILEQSGGLSSSMMSSLLSTLGMLPGFPSEKTIASFLPWAAGAATALITTGAAAGAAALMPGGLLLKAYAAGKVLFYGYSFWKLFGEGWVTDFTNLNLNTKQIFLSTTDNFINEKMGSSGFAGKISSKALIMPELPSDFATINGLTTESDMADYQEAIKEAPEVDPTVVDDWLGIPLAKFSEDTSSGYSKINAFTNVQIGSHGGIMSHAARIVKEALDGQDPESTIAKVGAVLSNNNYSLRELQRLDYFVGDILKQKIDGGVIDFDSNIPGYGHFKCTEQAMKTAINNDSESVIYFMCKNFDTVGAHVPLMGNVSDDDINSLVRDNIDIKQYAVKRISALNIEGADFLAKISPYVGGDTSRISGVIDTSVSGTTFIGYKFFEALELTIKEQFLKLWGEVKEWGKAVYDYFEPHVVAAAAGIAGFFSSKVLPALKTAWQTITEIDLSDPIGSFVTAFSGLWEAFTGLFKSSETDGDEDVASSKKGTKKASGRKVRPTVKKMQTMINRYIEREDMGIEPTEPDGVWGNDTNRVWQAVINKAFDDQGIFSDDPDAAKLSSGLTQWPAMSKMLNDDKGPAYERYTPDKEGAYEIIKDIFKGRLGVESGGGNTTDGETDAPLADSGDTGVRDTRGTRGDGGTVQRNNIGIEVLAGNNSFDTLEAVGFPEGTSKNVSDAVITGIRSMNFSGGMVTLKVKYQRKAIRNKNKGEVISIKLEKTQIPLRMISFKKMRASIKEVLTSGNSRVDMTKMSRKEKGRVGSFTLVLRIPPNAKRF